MINIMKRSTTMNLMCRFLIMVFMMCVANTASAQQTKITGTVKDPGGEPLIGVSVKVDKSGKGTVTDIDGYFTSKYLPHQPWSSRILVLKQPARK